MMSQLMGVDVAGWILTALVLLLLVVIGAVLKKPVLLLRIGNRATGVVVGWTQDGTLKAPIVEFIAQGGAHVRISGRVSVASHSVREGDTVTVLYRASDPRYAQLLLWTEFLSLVALLGIVAFIIAFWMVAILLSGDPGLGDPFGLLPRLVDSLHLDPVRDPQLFMLSLVIVGCAAATMSLLRSATAMRTTGLTAIGRVIEFRGGYSRLADGRLARGSFPVIAYEDATGVTHTIRRAAAWPLTRLRIDDAVAVIYLARRPDHGIVNTWDELYMAPLFFGALTLGFLVILVGVLRGPYG